MVDRRANPLVTVVCVAVIVAMALAVAWQWTESHTHVAPLQPTDPSVVVPDVALETPLLSFRRAPAVLSSSLNVNALRADLDPLLASVGDSSCVAVSIGATRVAAKNEQRPVVPASNMKLLVAAVALDVLGENHVFTTNVIGALEPATGTVSGDLYLVGGGDPVLHHESWPATTKQTYPPINVTSIEGLVQSVKAAGVTRITGRVVGDGSRYDDEHYAPSWSDGIRQVEAGPYDALMIDDSRIGDALSINPVLAAAQVFTQMLRDQGITIGGEAAVGTAPAATPLARATSLPLAAIVHEMLSTSDNNTAEMLVKEIGYAVSKQGTREAGLAVIKKKLTDWGFDVRGVVLADGSGLSSENRVTCAIVIGLLERSGLSGPIGSGLAVAGVDGTLRTTFVDTSLAGRLRAKTGTLSGAKALAGFVPADGAGALAFALILNGPNIKDTYAPVWNTRLVPALSRYPATSVDLLTPR